MILTFDPKYNPDKIPGNQINSLTQLGPGISIAKFLGSYGNKTSFNHIGSSEERSTIARQLYLQAEYLNSINGNTDLFNDVRLIVSEGIYKGGPEESISPNTISWKKSKGIVVVYQVVDRKGNISLEKTFDVAEYWKDYHFYNKLTLDYDTYDVSGILTSQIIVELPEIGKDHDVQFKMNVETTMNGQLLSSDELIEVLE